MFIDVENMTGARRLEIPAKSNNGLTHLGRFLQGKRMGAFMDNKHL